MKYESRCQAISIGRDLVYRRTTYVTLKVDTVNLLHVHGKLVYVFKGRRRKNIFRKLIRLLRGLCGYLRTRYQSAHSCIESSSYRNSFPVCLTKLGKLAFVSRGNYTDKREFSRGNLKSASSRTVRALVGLSKSNKKESNTYIH